MKHNYIRFIQGTGVIGLFVTVMCFAEVKPTPSNRSESDGEFVNWRNKPHEPFANGAKTFDQVKKMLLEQYYDQNLTEDDLYRAAVQGMLANIDPEKSEWNRLLTPKEVKEIMDDTAGKVVGIGVEISFDSESGIINILDIVKDSPAFRAGLKRGQNILKIDGKNFRGQQFRDVVYAMRGMPGTKVSVTILDDDRVRNVVIKRESLAWEMVTLETLPDGIALLSISYFTEQTPALIKRSLAKLSSQKVNGLIVDLRGNEGGLLNSAMESLDQLVPKGSIIAKVVKRGGQKEDLVAKTGSTIPKLPMAVLVNKDTKSSAEIAAGTLKHNCNAALVGHNTFGKWSSQRVENLANHYAIKFTNATFLAPDGQDLSGIGLTPDISVDLEHMVFEKSRRERDLKLRLTKDAQLQTAVNFLKKGASL